MGIFDDTGRYSKVVREYVFLIFPGVVALQVSFPFDEVLQLMLPSEEAVPLDCFNFKLLLIINHFRGR